MTSIFEQMEDSFPTPEISEKLKKYNNEYNKKYRLEYETSKDILKRMSLKTRKNILNIVRK